MLSALAFNIIPTIFEVGLVTGVLVCTSNLVSFAVFSLLIQPESMQSIHPLCSVRFVLWSIWLNRYSC